MTEIPAEVVDRMLYQRAREVLTRHQPYRSVVPGHPSRLCQQCGQCGQCGQEIAHPCEPHQHAQRAVHLAVGGVS